jgi:hypothetical protein
MLASLAIRGQAAELLKPVPFSWLELTSNALPETEMEAASTPSVVKATRTAATAMAGTNKTANRRQRTRPWGAGSAGSADVLVEGGMGGSWHWCPWCQTHCGGCVPAPLSGRDCSRWDMLQRSDLMEVTA